jgi:hypothetical protein
MIVPTFIKTIMMCEAQNLLGCTAAFLTECRPTFQRYVLRPSSGRQTSVNIQLRTCQYIPKDSELHTRRHENLESFVAFTI